MKHIKLFEKYDDFRHSGEWIYFKLIFNGSGNKLKIAIEKTGFHDLFLKTHEDPQGDCSIPYLYILFNPKNEIPGRSQTVIETTDDFKKDYKNLKYCGEITVEDYEVDAIKYNI